jgi:hypothetical protein
VKGQSIRRSIPGALALLAEAPICTSFTVKTFLIRRRHRFQVISRDLFRWFVSAHSVRTIARKFTGYLARTSERIQSLSGHNISRCSLLAMSSQGSFGQRQTPSLTEAYYRSPGATSQWFISPPSALTTPATSGWEMHPRASSQRVPAPRDSPIVELPAEVSCSQQPEVRLGDLERKLCDQLDLSLKLHYKRMKCKFKRVNSWIAQNDAAIDSIRRTLDEVTERARTVDGRRPPQIMFERPNRIPRAPQPALTCGIVTWKRRT